MKEKNVQNFDVLFFFSFEGFNFCLQKNIVHGKEILPEKTKNLTKLAKFFDFLINIFDILEKLDAIRGNGIFFYKTEIQQFLLLLLLLII